MSYEASCEGSASTEDGSSVTSGAEDDQVAHADIMMRQLLLEVREGAGEEQTCPDLMTCMHQQLFSPGSGKSVAGGAGSRE